MNNKIITLTERGNDEKYYFIHLPKEITKEHIEIVGSDFYYFFNINKTNIFFNLENEILRIKNATSDLSAEISMLETDGNHDEIKVGIFLSTEMFKIDIT